MPVELITALDVNNAEDARKVVQAAEGCSWFKVGFELFTSEGPGLLRDLTANGKQVFLDLKFHDIPNTVAGGVRAAAACGAKMVTVHAFGGKAMIAAAKEAAAPAGVRVLAVTILTSLDDAALRDELGLPESAAEAAPRLAHLAVNAGADGIVCSPREIREVRAAIGTGPLVVTPGIRPAWAAADDQARITTPKDAKEAGADFIVVGRPILRHEDPAKAVALILDELDA